jgi:apolipoprotein N-acyltransferase
MEFVNKRQAVLAAILAVGLSAVLVWFGNDLKPLWPLLWFAPVPVLVIALRGSVLEAGLAVGLPWLIGSFSLWGYLHRLGLPPIVFFGIFGIAAAAMAFAGILFRALVRGGAIWSGLLAFPATAVVAEYVRNLTTPHGTAGSLAYTQLGFLPFLQLASITGPWGMTFLLMLFPAALAIAFHLRSTAPRQAFRVLAASLGAVAVVLLFGVLRLAIADPGQKVRVGLIASDQAENADEAAPGADTGKLFTQYAAQARQLAERGARLVVLPEKLGVVLQDSADGGGNQLLQQVADETGAVIVAGEVYVDGGAHYNRALVFRPLQSALTYDKHHLLPPFENPLTPGTTELTFTDTAASYGVEICKDMDFTPLSRDYGHAHTGLMLVPAWDFKMDRIWHGHIAIMRAVEDGFSLVRAAKNGSLTVADSRGRVLAESRSDAQLPFTTLLASVPTGHSGTLYVLLGDWFAWLACAVFLTCLGRALLLGVSGWSVRSVPSDQSRPQHSRLPESKLGPVRH